MASDPKMADFLMTTLLSKENYEKVQEYWRNYPKDQHKSLARCYYGVRGGRIEDKIDSVENTMYTERSKERIPNIMEVIKALFSRDIQYIYDYRSYIRDDPNISLTSCELFHWMKGKDEVLYNDFKIVLSNLLKSVRSESEPNVKDKIVYSICFVLGTRFIKL